jgi:hypothetical protein
MGCWVNRVCVHFRGVHQAVYCMYVLLVPRTYRYENLSPAMGRGIDSRNRVCNGVAELHGGLVRQPYAFLVSSPHSGTKVTDTGPVDQSARVLPSTRRVEDSRMGP